MGSLFAMNAQAFPEDDVAVPDVVDHFLDYTLAQEFLCVRDSCNL